MRRMHCANSDSVRRSNPGVCALKHLTAYFDRKTTSHFSFIVWMYSTGDIANIMRDSVSRWGVGTQAGGRLGLRDTVCLYQYRLFRHHTAVHWTCLARVKDLRIIGANTTRFVTTAAWWFIVRRQLHHKEWQARIVEDRLRAPLLYHRLQLATVVVCRVVRIRLSLICV